MLRISHIKNEASETAYNGSYEASTIKWNISAQEQNFVIVFAKERIRNVSFWPENNIYEAKHNKIMRIFYL